MDTPVCDLKVDPHGHLWAVEGLAHMGGIRGALWDQQPDGWKAVVSIYNRQRRKIGWNLGYAALQTVGFDAEGRLYVVASDYGICRFEGRFWKPLVRHGGTCLHLVGSSLAVVGTDRSGIFLCRLDTGTVRQVLLVPPEVAR